MEKQKSQKRLWEIDLFRGIAVLGMIYFHFFYALDYLQVQENSLFEDGWETFGNTVRNIFFMVVGVSLVLALQRYKQRQKPLRFFYIKSIKRALTLILIGLAITYLSIQFTPDQVIRFGVLSFIGAGILILLPFVRYGILTALFTIAILSIESHWGETWSYESIWAYILGFYPVYWPSLDYFPLVPWLASISGGATLAHCIYRDGLRRYPFIDQTPWVLLPFTLIGRYALWIYLLHLPITVWIVQHLYDLP